MAKLILTEGGTTRRFKLSPGKLTFGSGDKVTLKLDSDDVAEQHGVIEMGDGGAVLHLAKGVMPAKIGTQAVGAAHVFKEGQNIKVGSATLAVEYDEGEGPPSKAAGVQRQMRGGTGRTRSQVRGDRGIEEEEEEGDHRRRHSVQRKSDPTGILIGLGVFLVLGGIGYYMISKTTKGLSGQDFEYPTAYARAIRQIEEDPQGSRISFTKILEEEISRDQRNQVQGHLDSLNERLSAVEEPLRNNRGNKWFEARLKTFYEKFDPVSSRPHARLFIKRAKWFMDLYPTHPENEWLQRHMTRVMATADLTSPQSIEDLRVEVKGSTETEPKDFVDAEEAIARFLGSSAEEQELAEAETIRSEVRGLEREFRDLMLQNGKASYSKDLYPKQYNPGTAMNDMIRLMACCNDEGFKSEGATRLLAITELKPQFLRIHYKNDRKEYWARMITVPEFQSYAAANGLL